MSGFRFGNATGGLFHKPEYLGPLDRNKAPGGSNRAVNASRVSLRSNAGDSGGANNTTRSKSRNRKQQKKKPQEKEKTSEIDVSNNLSLNSY